MNRMQVFRKFYQGYQTDKSIYKKKERKVEIMVTNKKVQNDVNDQKVLLQSIFVVIVSKNGTGCVILKWKQSRNSVHERYQPNLVKNICDSSILSRKIWIRQQKQYY